MSDNKTSDDLDFDNLDDMEIPDPEIQYETPDDGGCEGGACKI